MVSAKGTNGIYFASLYDFEITVAMQFTDQTR